MSFRQPEPDDSSAALMLLVFFIIAAAFCVTVGFTMRAHEQSDRSRGCTVAP